MDFCLMAFFSEIKKVKMVFNDLREPKATTLESILVHFFAPVSSGTDSNE